MIKNELLEQKSLKGCYGTKEWSENSGICCNCKLKKDCRNSIKNSEIL